ncbi:hypothetical protein ACFLW2_00150 [Chloroflexota bacterium]
MAKSVPMPGWCKTAMILPIPMEVKNSEAGYASLINTLTPIDDGIKSMYALAIQMIPHT